MTETFAFEVEVGGNDYEVTNMLVVFCNEFELNCLRVKTADTIETEDAERFLTVLTLQY